MPPVTAALGRRYYLDGTQAFEPVRPAEFYSAILYSGIEVGVSVRRHSGFQTRWAHRPQAYVPAYCLERMRFFQQILDEGGVPHTLREYRFLC